MGYDRGDSFPFDFQPNGVPFHSKSKGKLSPRSYHIQFDRKWNTSFLSACATSKKIVKSLKVFKVIKSHCKVITSFFEAVREINDPLKLVQVHAEKLILNLVK